MGDSQIMESAEPEKERRKKILVLADWYEPGYKAGGPIQSVKNFVSALHEDYAISVLTADTDLGEAMPYEGIPSNTWMDRQPGIRIYYASRKTLNSAKMRELIESEDPDFIYLNSMYSVRFSILPLMWLWRKKIKARVILSPRGMLRESAIQTKSKRKKLFISLLNRLHIPEKLSFHATDEQERKDILHYFPRASEVKLIPNFSAGLPVELVSLEKKINQLRCVFISRIMRIKNIQFFLEVLRAVPESVQLEFSIYGEIEDAEYWRQSQALIQSLPAHVHVVYYGSLPHAQVITTMEASHLFVLPTKGENFGHAIFESLSAGRPVLISDRTPWLGLNEKGLGWDLPIDDETPWLEAIKAAASFDQERFDIICRNCRNFAGEYMNNAKIKADYIKLFS